MSRRSTKAKAMCDSCSFVYDMRVMKLNSYDMLICPECFEGNYDLKNHPQNKIVRVTDDVNVDDPRLPVDLVSAVPVSAWLPSL